MEAGKHDYDSFSKSSKVSKSPKRSTELSPELKQTLKAISNIIKREDMDNERYHNFHNNLRNGTKPDMLCEEALNLMEDYNRHLTVIKEARRRLVHYVQVGFKRKRSDTVDVKPSKRINIWKEGKSFQEESDVAIWDKNKELWIMARITQILEKGKLFMCYDIANTYEREVVHDKDIIPVPSFEQSPLTTRRLFQLNEKVLAIYPSCTAFYPARVISIPKGADPQIQVSEKEKCKAFQYQLMFDEDSGMHKWIDADKVIPFREFRG